MSNLEDKDTFIEELLQERDELYLKLSRFPETDYDALLKAEKKNKELTQILEQKEELIRKLTDQLAWLRRKFWKPSSERYIAQDPNQRRIDFDGLDILPEEEEIAKEAEKEVISYERSKPQKQKNQAVRLPLPDYLRREERILMPEGIDENWTRIGEEINETLQQKPGELYVLRLIRPIFVLKNKALNQQNEADDQQKHVQIAPLPPSPLPRSNAGASLLAELFVGKYLFHMPFHRQIAMYKLSGVTLPASTVNGWFQGGSDLLRALYDRLKEIVLATDYIQVDESTIPVIDNQKRKAVKAYLWVVRSVIKELTFFHYDKGSRAQKVVVELLRNFQGVVQTDGYGAYSIYEKKKGVTLLGCWAHCRRKFSDSLKEDKAGAEYAIGQISLLYKVETMADEQNMNDQQRAELRERLSYPIMRAFQKWVESYFSKAIPNGRMYRALTYTYALFPRLSRFHLDGRYKIDTNLIENSIRGLAIGRKNFMFCGNHDAAENAAVVYSLIECCKASDVNPREWLTDVFSRLPVYNNDYRLDLADLLPHNWKAQRSQIVSN